jgi:hypothetical protein
MYSPPPAWLAQATFKSTLFSLNGHYSLGATPFHRRRRGPAEASPARDGSRLNPAGPRARFLQNMMVSEATDSARRSPFELLFPKCLCWTLLEGTPQDHMERM